MSGSQSPYGRTSARQLARTPSSASPDGRARQERALTERLYLISDHADSAQGSTFQVMGSRGVAYEVNAWTEGDGTLGLHCTCPDHEKRRQICKHLYFVLLRVMRVPAHVVDAYVPGARVDEVADFLARAYASRRAIEAGAGGAVVRSSGPPGGRVAGGSQPGTGVVVPMQTFLAIGDSLLTQSPQPAPTSSVEPAPRMPPVSGTGTSAAAAVPRADATALLTAALASATLSDSTGTESVIQRELTEEDTCPVCFETLLGEPLVFCRRTCGQSVHAACYALWAGRGQTGCVWCRAEWMP